MVEICQLLGIMMLKYHGDVLDTGLGGVAFFLFYKLVCKKLSIKKSQYLVRKITYCKFLIKRDELISA